MAAVLVSAAPALRRGGLHYDDWWLIAYSRYGTDPSRRSGFLESFGGVAKIIAYRPGSLVLYWLQTWFIGDRPLGVQLVALTSAALLALGLLALLRACRLPWTLATTAAALLACLPFASSARYWAAAALSVNTAGGCILFGSALLAWSMANKGWRGNVQAALGVSLIVFANLVYEAVFPLLALLPLLLWSVGGARRWRAVLALSTFPVVLTSAVLALTRTSSRTQLLPPSAWPGRARTMASEAAVLLARFILPTNPVLRVAMLLFLATAAAVGLGLAWGARAVPDLRPLRRGAILVGAGIAAVALGYVTLIPVSYWYRPLMPGQGDRTNGTSIIGFALVLVGLADLGASALVALVRQRRQGLHSMARRDPPGLHTLVLIVPLLVWSISGLGASWQQADNYAESWHRADALLIEIEGTLAAHPVPPGSTVLSFGSPGYVSPLIQVLSEWSDLDSAVKVRTGMGRRTTLPVLETQPVICGALGVSLPAQQAGGPYFGPAYDRNYGEVWFLHAAVGRVEHVIDRASCEALLPSFPPGPLYFSAPTR